jgi:hypothetical protein
MAVTQQITRPMLTACFVTVPPEPPFDWGHPRSIPPVTQGGMSSRVLDLDVAGVRGTESTLLCGRARLEGAAMAARIAFLNSGCV